MAGTPGAAGKYARITEKLFASLDGRPSDEPLREALLLRMADALVEVCAPRVTASEPAARLQQTMAALRDEGLSYQALDVDAGIELRRLDCRWGRLVGDGELAVGQERRVLARLLGVEAAQIGHDGVKFVYRVPVPAVRD